MLSREKINELATEAIEAVSVKIPEDTRWWLPEHFNQEFARLIIQEIAKAGKLQLVEKWFNSKEDKDKALGLLAEYDVMMGKEERMYLEITEIKDLIEGRIKYSKCPCCDTDGIVWFDSTRTSGVLPYPHPDIPEEDLSWETCHNCDGLSYILYR